MALACRTVTHDLLARLTPLPRIPLVLQSEAHECGLACLAMVAGTFDRGVDLASLRLHFLGQQLDTHRGLNLKEIALYAQSLRLAARGLRAEPGSLRQLRLPAILHWNMNHFVVLVAVKRHGIVIHDPAVGRVHCGWSEVHESFTGVVLELWPDTDFEPQRQAPPRLRLKDIVGLARHSGASVAWVFVLSLALQLIVIAGPWHVQWTVDEAIAAGDSHLVGVLAIGFGVLLLLKVATQWLRGVVVLHLGHELSFQLACRLLHHLLALPLTWFERRHVGDITSRFGSLSPVREFLTQGVAALMVDVLMVGVTVVVMLLYAPKIAALVVLLHLSFVLAYACAVPRLKRLGLSAIAAQAREQTHLLESARSMYTVKAYTLEAVRGRQWQRLHANTIRQGLALGHTQLWVALTAQLTAGVELIVVIYLAAVDVFQGALTVGMLYAFLSYRGHFAAHLKSLVDQVVTMKTLEVHLERLSDIWCAEPESLRTPTALERQIGGVPVLQLEQASFRYSASSGQLLRDVDLRIAPGEFVVIIGESGAGKSTLLKVLMSVLVPTTGCLKWGHAPVNGGNVQDYRASIACVAQEDGFFGGSVGANVCGFEDVDEQRLQSVLDRVGLTSILAGLPMGVRTEIGDIAAGFSSGELQRLYLARALYRNPDYLFLDEGTANLDPVSAALVQRLVSELDCTRVVVTHDMSFVPLADRAFELQQGQLEQIGV